MALTKVTSNVIADDAITSAMIAPGAIDDTHITGVTTTDIAEGTNQYYTDGKVGTYLNVNGYDTATNIISAITDTAPITLDTLNELAAALGDDPNFATTTATSLGLKAPLASPSFTGTATFSGNLVIANQILHAGDLILDAAGEIHLDSDSGIIRVRDAGGDFGMFQISSNDFIVRSMFSDADLLFKGNDGGSVITALTLDMSNAGYATFNSGLNSGGVIELPQKASFPATGFVHYTNGYLYAFGGVQGSIFKDRTGVTEFLKLQPSQIVFNEDGGDMDFRVESNGNANMLFVDGGLNIVSVGSSSVYQSGALEVFAQSDTSSQGVSINGASSATSFRLYTVGDVAKIGRGGDNPAISISTGNAVTINENSLDADFRVESNDNGNMLFVDAGNNSVGIGTNATGSTALVVQASAGAGAISIIGRANGGIGTLSFYDDNGTSNVGYLQGRADDNQFRLWTTTTDTLSLGQNDVERLRIDALGNTQIVNGYLGNSYHIGTNGAMWSVSNFNDNDANTGGYVVITTSANEWQPNLLKITGTSVSSGAATPTSAVWYVRVYTYNGTVGGVSVLDSWTSGSISVSVTGTYISATSVRVNVIITTSANRSVGNVEVLSYGGVTDSARTQ